MCAIGRALMACPDVLILDEPSLGLAPLIVSEIFSLIAQLRGDGMSILLVEQHIKNALAVADRGFVIESGRVTLSGLSSDLITNPDLRRAYMGQLH